jgi:predicted HTH transcriptional regulator
VLLFGTAPQRYIPAAEVKCLHFHGTTVIKPIPSYKVFKGTLFAQVDESVDFVMSKLNRAVGTRQAGPAAPVDYEIPRAVVAEAIVNAVAHRDYASAAAIQVYVFADRVEVWNPGELPPSLTPESLRQQHPSVPRNPLIAEPLFLAHYIEKVGTGTLDVIAGCQAAELPEPEFFQEGDQFVLRLWRDWLTAAVVASLGLNDRQNKALGQLKTQRRITNREYRQIAGTIARTAARDLDDLVDKGLLQKVGATGRSTYYAVVSKRDVNGTNRTSAAASTKRDINRTNRTSGASKSRQKKSGNDKLK